MPTEDDAPRLKRDVDRTVKFRRDLKREKKGQYRRTVVADLAAVIAMLADDIAPPARMVDHALTGPWKGSRDCHLHPDLVLIYQKVDPKPVKPPHERERPKLILVRLGSHAELGL